MTDEDNRLSSEEKNDHPSDTVTSHINERRVGLNTASNDSSTDTWDTIQKEISLEPENIAKWDSFFEILEEKIDALDKDEEYVRRKDFIKLGNEKYRSLLSKYPYLTSIWKNFSIFVFKYEGMEKSIDILRTSVEQFPRSLDLWLDYLSALITEYHGTIEVDKKNERKDYLRVQFDLAIDINGFNFHSDPLWDKYLEFEAAQGQGKESNIRYFYILLRANKTPLYQYARYYKETSEINKEFSLLDNFFMEPDKDALINKYLKLFKKNTEEEFSTVELHQIIDDYSYNIFLNTQSLVNELWTYESVLKFPDFSFNTIADIREESPKWMTYIEYEKSKYETADNDADKKFWYKSTISVIERSLVPNCTDYKFWLKYVDFVHHSFTTEQEKFEELRKIYERAIYRFVPSDDNHIRFHFIKFLMFYNKPKLALEYTMDLMKATGFSENKEGYQKNDYLTCISYALSIWNTLLSKQKLTEVLENIIQRYFDSGEKLRKQNAREEKSEEKESDVEEPDIRTFETSLNEQAICVVVNCYLTRLLDSRKPSTIIKIRKFYNKYRAEPALRISVKFWKFFVDFEGLVTHNTINLKKIISDIEYDTNLPKIIVDSFLDIARDILISNLPSVLESNANTGRSEELLLTNYSDESSSLVLAKGWRKRISDNNFLIQNLEDSKAAKQHGKQTSNQSLINKEDELLKLIKSHADHPGIPISQRPEITNSLIYEENWINLNDHEVPVPPLPSFKNVEKASLPINYPSET
ncbi:Piso0_000366 [Millerozyma farinosa CBS 7064]|uniref:Piso0_000366 protein n=1 Tax=Pichia sorbitophila (strain ATCC MYA-4447 / BCRC 22081 / CBS 7064 / NBRC 10061 / NRRL Y-12695) TaxID=559304 RepID=G8YTT2_PICSO|nr:Piso0_000366 [Millerozyma farinosa CBS 7064]CCE73333.1 Piso0_000366 [Millerozyma farinosa CBS 7064]